MALKFKPIEPVDVDIITEEPPKKQEPVTAKEVTHPASELDELVKKFSKVFDDAGDNRVHQIDAVVVACKELLKRRESIQEAFIETMCDVYKWITKRDFVKRMNKIKKANEEAANDDKMVDLPEVDKIEQYITDLYEIRYNVIANRYEIREHAAEKFDEINLFNIARRLRKRYVDVSVGFLKETIYSEFTPNFNPIEMYFKKLPAWDGTDYITQLSKYIMVYDNDRARFELHFKKMFVRIISAAFGASVNKRSLVLVGGQDAGKSTFTRWLCPTELKEYYTEDVNFSESTNGLRSLSENIFVVLDEIANMPRNDINTIKAIMSKDTIKVRLPYDRNFTMMKRRCSFIASTNEEEFLTDPTGNVRWIAFLLKDKGINWDYKKDIAIDNVWAQAYYLFKNGFPGELSKEELLENEEANMQFMVKTTEVELIPRFYERSNPDDPEALFWQATDFLHDINLRFEGARPNISLQGIGKTLKLLKYHRTSKRIKESGMSLWGYYVRLKNDTAKNIKHVTSYYKTDGSRINKDFEV